MHRIRPQNRQNVRICLLTTQDLDADPFPDDDWPCDPRPFLPDAEWHVATLAGKHACLPELDELLTQDFDLYFNLCDGAEDQEDVPGIEVVQKLEASGSPFVGAVAACYEPTRARMKEVCAEIGIATPRHAFASTEADVEAAATALRFPLFVKHHSSYASVSLSRNSRCRTPAGLRIQARKIIRRHGRALIEEYIDGQECTTLVAEHPDPAVGATAFTPIAYRFPPGEAFKHSDLKWVDYASMQSVPVEDETLAARLRDEAVSFYRAIGAASFARCDFRVDAAGTPHLLEINPNCGVYYPPDDAGSADLCLMHDPAGHRGFTEQLVAAALARAGA